ncbi:uncharacterized protein [Drosophila kikkawai]|uniref:Uncharacterized protein n=1 Tax=Drosophila kikkawai TaxID=30033 RepID=A0A6P4I0T6_DROKI|nr:uncharacterized protein LOC108074283 [Drosophila kikkawai]
MQEQEAMTRKRGRTRNRSKQRNRRRGCRQRREGKPPQQQLQRPPQPTAREQWARGAEMCIQTSRSLFEWHHNQVMSLCQGLRQQEATLGTQHCLDYVYESSSEEDEQEEELEQDPEPIDEGYLKFLEVTIKHQEELRRRRADTTTAGSDELSDKN